MLGPADPPRDWECGGAARGRLIGKISPALTIQQMLERGKHLGPEHKTEYKVGELMKRGRKRKRVGAPPKKTPWDSVVSPQGTRAHLTCQLRTWKKSGGRADLKPEELPGELGRGEWALSRVPAVQFFPTRLRFHQGSCWLMPQTSGWWPGSRSQTPARLPRTGKPSRIQGLRSEQGCCPVAGKGLGLERCSNTQVLSLLGLEEMLQGQ